MIRVPVPSLFQFALGIGNRCTHQGWPRAKKPGVSFLAQTACQERPRRSQGRAKKDKRMPRYGWKVQCADYQVWCPETETEERSVCPRLLEYLAPGVVLFSSKQRAAKAWCGQCLKRRRGAQCKRGQWRMDSWHRDHHQGLS